MRPAVIRRCNKQSPFDDTQLAIFEWNDVVATCSLATNYDLPRQSVSGRQQVNYLSGSSGCHSSILLPSGSRSRRSDRSFVLALRVDVDAFFPQALEQCIEVVDDVVHHERG